MQQKINPIRYPTLYMYLARLPQGIASHPEAQTHASLHLALREQWPDVASRGDLPQDIVDAVAQPYKPTDWVPEVVFMALTALVRDVVYRDDEGYLKFCYDSTRASFSSVLMRAVMHFVSPSLLAMNASKRWAMLKRGTTLTTVRSGKGALEVRLSYPANLYHPCMLAGIGRGLQAALDGTKVKSTTVLTKPVSDKECRFDISWVFE